VVVLDRKYSCSSRYRDADLLWLCLAMFELFSQNSKSENFGFGHGFLRIGSIGENARELWNFCDPAPVRFSLTLESEIHTILQELFASLSRRPHTAPPRAA
jgi:hypothetical protein